MSRVVLTSSAGDIPIDLDSASAPNAAAALLRHATRGTRGTLHRAEPVPPAGSAGPPYALVQFTLDAPDLKALAHECARSPPGAPRPIARGDVCLIGGASDVFVSLARRGEHAGWEGSMTVLGRVAEPALEAIVEGRILAMPIHDFTHPNYGTVMSMLDEPLPCQLRLP